MPSCPLCQERTAKRFCPAKEEYICAVCCGTKREIEIDCPGSCVHLQACRSYEAEKRIPDPELAARVRSLDRQSFQQLTPILEAASRIVIEERLSSPWLVDVDVLEVYKALRLTLNTLSSGIYYETVPEGPIRSSLYRKLKDYFDQLMMPQPNATERSLKVTEMIQLVDFLTLSGELHAGNRSRSRRYLDWLMSVSGVPARQEQSSGLIVP